MNYNLEKLCLINNLLDELIYIDLKFNKGIFSQIIDLVFQIKYNIDFLITQFYFINIIEFESKKNQIIIKVIFIENKIFIHSLTLSNHIIKKINYIKNIIKEVVYPAYLNANNNVKYIKEIKEIKETKIIFYHKPETIGIKDNFYDEELDLDDDDKKSNIKFNDKKSNIKFNDKKSNIKFNDKKNYVINKTKGKIFLSNIDFGKSYINI
jgi:hypothetical protein